jgi:succinate dehydrogenase / fumarate reductase cytochrome b subunit
VGVTGLLLLLFVVMHLGANLLIFDSADAVNAYGASLRHLPLGALWIARIGLLAVAVTHIFFTLRLALANKQARPIPYAKSATVQASRASLSMVLSGTLVLAFLVFHLLHFTLHKVGNVLLSLDTIGRPDIHAMVVSAFHNPFIVMGYIGSMVLLTYHLSHGIASLCQTFGLRGWRNSVWVDRIGPILAGILGVGFVSIPVAIWLGLVVP